MISVFSLWFLIGKNMKISGITPFSTREWLLLSGIGITIFLLLPLAVTPPSVRDELIQHLALPKLYIQKGGIFEIPFMPFSYLPMNMDLLYLVPMLFGSDIAPRLLHFGFGILSALTVYAYVRPRWGRSFALLGFFLFFSMPVVINASKTAYVDLGVMFFSTLAVVGILEWKQGGKWLFYSSLAMGFALGIKYNAFISLLLCAIMVTHISIKRRDGQIKALMNGAIYVLISISVFSPWLIRNYAWTGSPFYPFYTGGIASKTFTEGEGVHFGVGLSPIGKRYLLYGEDTLDIFLVPLRIFLEGKDNFIERFDGVLNPFLLIFLAIAFLRRDFRDFGYLLVFSALFFYMAFFTTDLVIRYIFPVLPLVVVISVWGAKNSFERRGFNYIGIISIASVFVFNLFYIKGLYDRYKPMGYLMGKESRDSYLERVLPDYKVTSFANKNLPGTSKVQFLFAGDRGYYWERDYYYGSRTGDDLIVMMKNSRSNNEFKDRFLKNNITHIFTVDVLFVRFALDNFNQDELNILQDFVDNSLRKLYTANGFSLYEIKNPL